jgi:hypothetical protein
MLLLERYYSCPKLFNTLAILLIWYPKNTLGSMTYLLKLGGVLHSLTKTYKETNTLIALQYIYHGLNYFGSCY